MLSTGPIATDRAQMLGTAERVIWRILLAHVGGGSGCPSPTSTSAAAAGILLLTVETVVDILLLLLKGCRDLLVERTGTGRAAVVARRERAHTSVEERYVRFEIGFHVLGRQRTHVTNEGGIETCEWEDERRISVRHLTKYNYRWEGMLFVTNSLCCAVFRESFNLI